MKNLKIRCSSIGKIMADAKGYGLTDVMKKDLEDLEVKKTAKGLTDKQQEKLDGLIARRDAPEKLSTGAETYIKSLVNQEVLEYNSRVYTPEMKKGHEVENESIELFNEVFGSTFQKHNERKEDEFIEGECDCLGEDIVIDIKSPWSIETFPAIGIDGKDSDYEWQLRGYMKLYDVENATLAYCLVDTPEDLRRPWESLYLHEVSHIEPRLRISTLEFTRDRLLEKKIESKVEACRVFYKAYKELLLNKNK